MNAPKRRMRRRPDGREIEVVDVGGRVPPHNLEAEAAVLAALLADGRRIDDVAGTLTASEWYSDANQRVYEAMLDLRERSQPIDLQTVAAWLKDRDWIQAIGGIAYLAKLIDSTPAVAHIDAYARIIRGKAKLRELINLSQLIAAQGFIWEGDDAGYFEYVAREMGNALENATPVESVTLAEATAARMIEIREVWAGELDPAGMQTRFARYNALTNGLLPGQLHTVCALTNGGKSAWSWEVCLDVAGTEFRDELVGCVAVSAEMPAEQLVDRGIAIEGAPRRRFLQRDPHPDVVNAVEGAARVLSGKPVDIIARPLSLEQIRAAIRAAQRKFDRARRPGEKRTRVRFVLVDYLQILDLPDERDMRVAISKLTRALKRIALECGVHLMLVSQLTRDVGKGARRPTLFDLKESGSIENDSDLVTAIHRPVETTEVEERRSEEWQALEDYAEAVLLKARENAKGKFVELAFEGARTRFDEPTNAQIERWKSALAALKSKPAPPASRGFRNAS